MAVYLTSGELGLKHLAREAAWRIREKEAQRAARILGVAEVKFLRGPDWSVVDERKRLAKELGGILESALPDLIYLPHPQEWHPDHKAASGILCAALRRADIKTPTLLGYEVWTPLTEYDQVADISDVFPRKRRALRAHRSQLAEFDYVRAVRGLNEFRGALAGKCRFAEVFQTLNLNQDA